jgi:hypothetical protein
MADGSIDRVRVMMGMTVTYCIALRVSIRREVESNRASRTNRRINSEMRVALRCNTRIQQVLHHIAAAGNLLALKGKSNQKTYSHTPDDKIFMLAQHRLSCIFRRYSAE